MKTRQSLRNVDPGGKKNVTTVADGKIKKPTSVTSTSTKARKAIVEPMDSSSKESKKDIPEVTRSSGRTEGRIKKQIETEVKAKKQVAKSLTPTSAVEPSEAKVGESKPVTDLKSKKQSAALKAEKQLLMESCKDSMKEKEKTVTPPVTEEIKKETETTGIKTRKQVMKPTDSKDEEKVPEVTKTPEFKSKKQSDEVSMKTKLRKVLTPGPSDSPKEKIQESRPIVDLKTKKQTAAVKAGKELMESLYEESTATDLNIIKKLDDAIKMKVREEPTEPADSSEEKENLTLERFYQIIKQNCVLSERWVLNEPKQDISLNAIAILVIEIDITIDGDLRVKRCVKILEDRSFKVLLDGVDMTHLFDVNKKIATTNDVVHLLYSVQMKKICQGLRNYVPNNTLSSKETYPARLRGTLWYAKDCTIVVQKVFMGNSCSVCSKIRNQIKRKTQNEIRRKMQIKPTVKQVKRSFGKAVYSTLNDFIGKGLIPASQYPRENMVYDDKLEVYLNQELQNRLEAAASMPPPPPPPPKLPSRPISKKRPKSNVSNRGNRYSQPSATITSAGVQEIQGLQEFITEDGQICYVTNVMPDSSQTMAGLTGLGEQFQWGQMVVEKFEPPEMEDMMTLNDHENIIIQNIKGETFTLAEGQEYELIGEAQPTRDHMELMSADNQQIQIIEVDDETLAQIQVHEGMENMQIAHVDPNDPNFRQLLQAFQAQGMAL